MIYAAFGGGINSTAMLIEMVKRSIFPSWVVFADTGGEKPETYAHVGALDSWLKGKGLPGIITVRNSSKLYSTLEDECLKMETLPAIAFGFRSCSDKWKQNPQEKYMNSDPYALNEWKSGRKIVKAIGFGLDELHRAKEFESKKYQTWYPLIEWRMNRNDCIESIKSAGLEIPPKSSCFYCPAMRKSEIVQLSKTHPELYDRALKIEENATKAHTAKGLGRSFSWKELVGPETIEQVCICFDGEAAIGDCE